VKTKRIKLSSAVTVISSDDPVRVYQDFATVDLLSNGRAEIMAGRGSFIESFPLFGYDLEEYDDLFQEKLQLLMKLQESEKITWSGRHRAELKESRRLSARGADQDADLDRGRRNAPIRRPRSSAWSADGARHHRRRAGPVHAVRGLCTAAPAKNIKRDPSTMPVSINSHGYIAEDAQTARDEYYPPYAEVMGRIGKERNWPPPSRARFDAECDPHGALFVGSPQQIIDKIMYEYELFRHQRFGLQFSVGTLPHEKMLKTIELFATKVAPVIRKSIKHIET
jgi:alkanesulfonate monooxygenase SsuD/methylene tetrahydromethanopterin reductase-like flavin-dependent oxidoreductase (luciferase family)